MANGFMVVNEKDWEKADPEQRDWMIFNTMQSMNRRLEIIEGRRMFDKTCSFLGGVLGGIGAMFGMRLWK